MSLSVDGSIAGNFRHLKTNAIKLTTILINLACTTSAPQQVYGLDWKSANGGSDPFVGTGIKLRRRTYHICPVRLLLQALALNKSQKLILVLSQR
jgi:hypothetical protein